jgi:hypothetical protein
MPSSSDYLDIITNLKSNTLFFNKMHIYRSLLLEVISYRTDVAGVASTSEVRAPAMLLPAVRVSHVRFISFNTCVL